MSAELIERLRLRLADLNDVGPYEARLVGGEGLKRELREAADALEAAEEEIALLTRTIEALGRERLTQMETGRP